MHKNLKTSGEARSQIPQMDCTKGGKEGRRIREGRESEEGRVSA